MIIALIMVGILFPNFDLKNILSKRFKSFVYKDTFSRSYATRAMGAQTEFDLWYDNSSLILGLGSSLPPDYLRGGVSETGALGHVGFTTYLAHFGIIGIIIYAFLLPITTLRISRRYYIEHAMDYGGKIALIAIFCSLTDLIGLAWSHHHLFATSHVIGLIYGAMWGLYRSERVEKRKAFYNNMLKVNTTALGENDK